LLLFLINTKQALTVRDCGSFVSFCKISATAQSQFSFQRM